MRKKSPRLIHMGMRRGHQYHSSSSSSIDSNTNDGRPYKGDYCPDACSSSSFSSTTKDLSTDLRLGLSISSLGVHPNDFPSSSSSSSNTREHYSDWPPIKPFLRSTLGERWSISNVMSRPENNSSLFVKVYMEGIPIGRKLDLFAHDGYHSLVTTLSQMFKTTILYSDIVCQNSSGKCNLLTYEDQEGDWMMVGDVPWEIFLTAVKRLKITTLDKC